ncbi:MAG: flagellar hook protein FlgE [Gemmatimonadales bacterium]|nr:MAG: flagellar hook protein FlgE [Gemmatimonadales bacterium]
MMRSIFSGVSGLRNHQTRMDVIGNNIANVNTVGFKASRVTFKEGFAQILQGASRPPGDTADVAGGTNPVQVGLGMNIGSIDLLFTQGSLESTGVNTDLAIQGDSFFMVSDGTQQYFTRAGNFQLDANGRLVAATNGFVVQGRLADDNGVLGDRIQDIVLPFGQKSPARATQEVTFAGNLNAEAEEGTVRETTVTVYDRMGVAQRVTVSFEKQAGTPPTWNYTVDTPGGTVVSGASGTLTFDGEGRLADPLPTDPFIFTPDSGADDVEVVLNFGQEGGLAGLTQFAAPSTAVVREQDGFTMGDLQRFSIDSTGTVFGAFSNGVTLVLGQVALADFNNPAGLERVGDNQYVVSPNSGQAVIGFAGEGSQSSITAGALEMSNVDLAQEFTNMITTQRGFQSNARVISTSDEMLQEVVTLKR